MGLKKLRILISNDDGVNAPGIKSLYTRLHQDFDITVVAPSDEKSTTGHSLSLDHPVRLSQISDNPKIYHINGFPADTILMGLGHVMKEVRPDVIVSGINRGANLSQDLYYSGTMAAAREGAFHGIASIAVSTVVKKSGDPYYFDTAAEFIAQLLHARVHETLPKLSMLNVNVPNIPISEIKGAKISCMGFRTYSEQIDKRIDSRDRSYYWIAGHLEGFEKFNGKSDCEVIDQGAVSVTPLGLLIGHSYDFKNTETALENLRNFPQK